MSSPKISIITPSYNQGEYIEETIISIINQNYNNIEYIIIDGGSTDNTINIIKKYDKYISYWVSEEDEGQSDAINKGLKLATGDIINWLNSDDYLEPDILSKIANSFIDGIHCVTGRSLYINQNNDIVFCNTGSWVDSKSYDNTLKYLLIEQPSTFFSKQAVSKMGILTNSLHYVMDKEWWLKYLLNYDIKTIANIDSPIVNFRLQVNSKTVAQPQYFLQDQATLYYGLSKRFGLIKQMDLLNEKYKVDKSYSFDNERIDYLKLNSLHNMLRFFIHKEYSQIFNRKDFKLAKKAYKMYPTLNKENVDILDITFYNRLKRRIKFRFWVLFRIQRKVNFLLKKEI